MRFLGLFLVVFFYSYSGLAQNAFRIGYAYNFGNPKEINRVIHTQNLISDFEESMPYMDQMRGLFFSYGKHTENGGFECEWRNRHGIVGAMWMDNGVPMSRQYKHRQNTLNFNIYVKGGVFSVGSGFGIGSWKGFIRNAMTDSIENANWSQLYVTESTELSSIDWLWTTKWSIPFFIGLDFKYVGIRFIYQYQLNKMVLDHLDNALIGRNVTDFTPLEGKFSNFGIELFVRLVYDY